MKNTFHFRHGAAILGAAILMSLALRDAAGAQIPPMNRGQHFKKQGFSIKLQLNAVGAIGHVAYYPFDPGNPGTQPVDSLGLEYPAGRRVEHIYGGGVWIGGLVDTSLRGNRPPLRLVSVSYEGWSGNPYFEFYPGRTPADTVWVARRGQPQPPGWLEYWGSSLPYSPISDQDMYVTYTDTNYVPNNHTPMRLKVIQASYAWNDPYAEAILIFEYRIINMGRQRIDSAYFAYFFEPDVGPIDRANFWTRNYSAYLQGSRTAYAHNPVDEGSTPIGAALLATSGASLDSLRYTFQWFPGGNTPPDDPSKYTMMSSGVVREDEFPRLSDTRFVFSFGPFTMQPQWIQPDTFLVAVAIISGSSPSVDPVLVLARNAARALDIYLNQGIKLPSTPPSPPLRVNVGFRRVELDWKWRPGDDVLYERPDPEQNWDTTNQVARRYPDRINNPPPGVDGSRGGRNFEAYKVWRSENPNYPDNSFTLLAQYDYIPDSFEYESGLKYTFVDSNLVRGKTYVYSVTSKSIPNLAYQEVVIDTNVIIVEVPVEPLESSKLVNAVRVDLPFAVSENLGKVAVVPNPYRTDRDYTLESGGYEGPAGSWDEGKRKIKFINLPERCTIRVFSLAGDLIREMQHDGTNPSGFSRGDVDMLLVSDSNRALASGIYIFTVESAYGTETGKFVIIR